MYIGYRCVDLYIQVQYSVLLSLSFAFLIIWFQQLVLYHCIPVAILNELG